ncbi:hypothetical protein DFP83_11310 [Idiomarina fontislapidosi]|uniref:Uncharacterized protein n=1 Tax=Idiomarina fontislapidosi TaxID=263723 RepID=A0A432XR48_9GAMM|nr:hypothetical protein [Idiomarina fontislapidosi]PYE30812.1 hypothetical protein DFP83_11310 [Idiomarina fontislapidosi]RUO51178.1 hypothetical protein CWE25_11505 [Idiomarina fontislapidosi]
MKTVKEQLSKLVKRDLEEAGSYDELSQKTGISRSTLFRIANQEWQRPGRAIEEAAKKYDVQLRSQNDATQCEPVLKVISEIWDGTDKHAKALADTLKKVHTLALYSR